MRRWNVWWMWGLAGLGSWSCASESDGGIPWVGECSEAGVAGCLGDQRVVCLMGDGQLRWTVAATCARGCQEGRCVGEGSCPNECPSEGLIGCSGNRLVACLEGDGCLRWAPVADCSLGCENGRCVGSRTCSCEGRVCGDDGCGRSCGECPEDQFCGQDFACYDRSCVPDCSGRNCGGDGCGGTCGTCAGQERCLDGRCVVLPPGPEILSVTFRTFAGDQFPAYLAHLYGTTLSGEWELHFVDRLVIRNPDPDRTYDVVVRGELQGYSAAGVANVRLLPLETKEMSLDVPFDLPRLYQVSVPIRANALLQVFAAGQSLPCDSRTQAVRIVPKNSFLVRSTDDPEKFDMFQWIAVFVTPHDSGKQVERLLTEAARHSRFGNIAGYQNCVSPRGEPILEDGTWTLPPSGCQVVATHYYMEGMGWPLRVVVEDCLGCDQNASFLVVPRERLAAWKEGDADAALVRLWNLGAYEIQVQIPAEGYYHLIACNPTDNFRNRTFRVRTARGIDACVRDTLAAIFDALKARGTVYTSVDRGSFVNGQYVKFPAESLATNSANCLDGALVFASALEAAGFQPAILRAPGHAFVAARIYPQKGSPWVAIETTMVSTGTAREAIEVATYGEWSTIQQGVDIAKAREAGVLPAPL